ncbi:MAG: ArsR family transcriptional regulator [Thermoproteota archaeon]|nr:ArsR family transcriptional regulator [Thermoproteota archaeon]
MDEDKKAAEVFQALASEVRIRIVKSLKEGPKTWSELMFSLKVNPKILDESLKRLIKAGVVIKDGNKYRLTDLGDYVLQIITPIAELAITIINSFLQGLTSTKKKEQSK